MIRINLLAVERPSQKKKAVAAAPGALQAYLFLALFGGGTALGCGFLWLMQSRTLQELDAQTKTATDRLKELQAIKAKVDEFEKLKNTLDAKIALIESLQAKQSAPVHMLDEISRALPDYVWLTALEQTGDGLRLKGEANALSAVADYMVKLGQAGAPECAEAVPDRSVCYFDAVELVNSTEQNNVVTYEVSARFRNAFLKLKAKTAPPAAAPPAPASGAAAPPSPAPAAKS